MSKRFLKFKTKCEKVIILAFVVLSVTMLCSNESNTQFTVIWEESIDQHSYGIISIEIIDRLPERKMIDNFDVRDDSTIAIVFSGWEHIAVLDKNGTFLYGFKIKLQTNGGIYVEWGDEFLNVLTNRGDYIFSLDKNGQIVAIGKLTNREWIDIVQKQTRVVNGNTYVMRNSFLGLFGKGYAQLNKYDAEGSIVTLYHVPTHAIVINLAISILASLLLIIVLVLLVIKYFKKRKVHQH